MSSSSILLTGIVATGRHGANAGERDEPQKFVVDLDVTLEVRGDSLEDTLDYRVIADTVRNTVSQTSFVLLESLADAVARALYDFSQVLEVTATVHKPRAADSMGLDDLAAGVSVGP
jgi:dihydroneopterin aldolase